MLDSITLRFTENDDLSIPAAGITVFVGPNNSGKSLFLKEVETAFQLHPFNGPLKILREYKIVWPSHSDVNNKLEAYSDLQEDAPSSEFRVIARINPHIGLETGNIHKDTLNQTLTNKSPASWFLSQVDRFGIIRLDGRSRFNLTNDQAGGDLLASPRNILAHFFKDDDARKRVRSLVLDAFNLHFVIDPTNLGHLRIRLSAETPPLDEQSLNAEARRFHGEATHIKDASDGVQAFTGIVAAVLCGEFHTVLIDEPEAFLHPPLARKLGKNLATIATERGGSLMASTHSADFLMGCVHASKAVRVVRLEYGGGKSRGRMIDPKELEILFTHPLMRSANVISGLFYDGVVVTESDNDRVFYAEIYQRLVDAGGDVPSVLFVNAQNKQKIKDMLGPLRRFGVPAAAIPDIDILKDGGKTWTDWLTAAQMPPALFTGYAAQRGTIESCFKLTGKDMKSDGGVEVLNPPDKAAANKLFDDLAEFGVFAVRRGELENWLPMLAVPGKKTNWTVGMLQRLGGDPADPAYVKPATGDVWDFMRGIIAWIKDPGRKGTG